MMEKLKWQHDGIDTAETWWLGPDGCDTDDAIATVSPEWSAARAHGQGRPDGWVARDAGGKRLGKFPTRSAATKAASAAVTPISSSTAKKTKKPSDAQLAREIEQITATPPKRFNEDQAEDSRDGFYYVTAIDGGRTARIAGPYTSHGKALDKVRTVKERAEDIDARAVWWAWGTIRSEKDLGPGALGVI